MRKLSVQEIIEKVNLNDPNREKTAGGSPITSSSTRTPRIKKTAKDFGRKKEEDAKRKREANKPTPETAQARLARLKADDVEAARDIKRAKLKSIQNAEARKETEATKKNRDAELETAQARVSSKQKLAQKIRGKSGYKPEKINNPKKYGVGGAARNLARAGTNLARNAAAISTNLSARKDRKEAGRLQMQKGQAPSDGTTKQKIGFATKPVRQAATNVKRATGRGIEKVGSGMSRVGNKIAGKPKKPAQQRDLGYSVKPIKPNRGQVMQDHYNYNEDFIGEAEKKGEKKKEKIDVMKGTNKVEVNPKMQAEAKKMTKKQIKKRDEIADAISSREMKKRYGDTSVKYAIATKLAMEAKVDDRKIFGVTADRNERRFGKKGAFDPQGSGPRGQDTSERAKLAVKRGEEHRARRGVKTKGVKEDVTLQDANGNDFVQIVDLIKPEPLVKARSVQEISECWKTHKQVGYKKKGGRMVPNCVPKNEEVELGEMKGLVKFDAMVAANKKKRKNALQIQKVIGEQTKEVDKKKLNKSLEKSLELTNYGSAEPFLSKDELKKRTEAKRKKRERIAKGDDRTTAQYNKDNLETTYQKTRLNQIFKTEGKGSNPNKRYIGDPNVTSKKQFTKTGAIGVEITNPDEEQGIQQRRNTKEKEREEKRKRIEKKKEQHRKKRQGDIPFDATLDSDT